MIPNYPFRKMISIVDRVIISLLFTTNFLFADILKITLNSGDEVKNCKNLRIEDDSLHLSLSVNDDLSQVILIGNIRSIVTQSNSDIIKYDFTEMSRTQKTKTLGEIIVSDFSQFDAKAPLVPDLYSDKSHLAFLISIIFVISIVSGTVFIFRFVKKKRTDETIHGAKEMVATMLMWAKKHREKALKD
ncbi:MAG: hypothetical protein ACE5EE_08590 [Fidelibacterota bacterium]